MRFVLIFLFLLISATAFSQGTETGTVRQMQQLQEQLPAETKFADCYDKLKAAPRDPQVHLQLGQLYLEHQLFELAIQSFHQALQFQPSLAEAHLGLSQVFRKKGLKAWEIVEMEEAVRLDPANPERLYALGVLYMEPASFNYKKAEKQYKALEKTGSPLLQKLATIMQK